MSELLVRKLRTYFKHFDVDGDGDGFISLKDIQDMATRYCDARKTTDAQKEDFTNTFSDAWRRWNKSSGTGDSGVVTPSIFIESIKQQRNDPEFKVLYQRLCHQYFRLQDLNGDGFLQEEECAQAFAELGLQDISFTRTAFESMDLNRDGRVSLNEYSTAVYEYLTSEDENNRYTVIFGPLV